MAFSGQWPMMLISLILLALGIWVWQNTLRAREQAYGAAVRTCRKEGLQLLDATVTLQRMRPHRCAAGILCLHRTFVFDYTDDGEQRQQGFILMEGPAITTIGLASEFLAG